MAKISDWSSNELENVALDEYSLSEPGKRPFAKIMAAVKDGFNGIAEEVEAVIQEVPAPDTDRSTAVAPTYWIVDKLRQAVEMASGGSETVLYDKWGNPHVMVILPKFDVGDIDASLGSGTHPAFQYEDGNNALKTVPEIFIGKYLASNDGNGHPVTLPRRAPWIGHSSIGLGPHKICREMNDNYGGSEVAGWLGGSDKAVGLRWSMCTLPTYAARLLMQYKLLGEDGAAALGGNSDRGKDYSKPWQSGTLVENGYNTTYTGSGPAAWYDDGIGKGLCDLIGNVQEAVYDALIVKGQLRITPYNNAVKRGVVDDYTGPRRYLNEDGTLGTFTSGNYNNIVSGGLCYDGDGSDGLRINTSVPNKTSTSGSFKINFADLEAASGVSIPDIMRVLCLAPVSGWSQPGKVELNNADTGNYKRCLVLGGGCLSEDVAGLNCLSSVNFQSPPNLTGFRVMYM